MRVYLYIKKNHACLQVYAYTQTQMSIHEKIGKKLLLDKGPKYAYIHTRKHVSFLKTNVRAYMYMRVYLYIKQKATHVYKYTHTHKHRCPSMKRLARSCCWTRAPTGARKSKLFWREIERNGATTHRQEAFAGQGPQLVQEKVSCFLARNRKKWRDTHC